MKQDTQPSFKEMISFIPPQKQRPIPFTEKKLPAERINFKKESKEELIADIGRETAGRNIESLNLEEALAEDVVQRKKGSVVDFNDRIRRYEEDERKKMETMRSQGAIRKRIPAQNNCAEALEDRDDKDEKSLRMGEQIISITDTEELVETRCIRDCSCHVLTQQLCGPGEQLISITCDETRSNQTGVDVQDQEKKEKLNCKPINQPPPRMDRDRDKAERIPRVIEVGHLSVSTHDDVGLCGMKADIPHFLEYPRDDLMDERGDPKR